MNTGYAILTLRVPTDLKEALAKTAQARDRSLSGEMREALREHLTATNDKERNGNP
jgi:predicted transcriptional regulator